MLREAKVGVGTLREVGCWESREVVGGLCMLRE